MELLEPYILKDMLGGLAPEVDIFVTRSDISGSVAVRYSAGSWYCCESSTALISALDSFGCAL